MTTTRPLEEYFQLNEDLIEAGLMTEDLLDGQRFEDITVPTPWAVYAKFKLTQEVNNLYAFSTQDPSPWYASASPFGGPIAHPVALVQLGTRPVLREFPVFIPPDESSLHAKMECTFLAPALVGGVYAEEGRLAEKYIKRGRRYLVTEGRFRDEHDVEVLIYRHTRMVGRDK